MSESVADAETLPLSAAHPLQQRERFLWMLAAGPDRRVPDRELGPPPFGAFRQWRGVEREVLDVTEGAKRAPNADKRGQPSAGEHVARGHLADVGRCGSDLVGDD